MPDTHRDVFRAALADLPLRTSTEGYAVPIGDFVTPTLHMDAVDVDVPLVLGGRGAGKSTWFTALLEPDRRKQLPWRVGVQLGFQDQQLERADVVPGFGGPPGLAHPGMDGMVRMLGEGLTPRVIWRSVVAMHAEVQPLCELRNWSERAHWVASHPDEVDAGLAEADERRVESRRKLVVLFDRLDRTGETWHQRQVLLRGLLEVVLDMSATRMLRGKAFVRPDMLSHPTVQGFPDAAKLIAQATRLEWAPTDLYHLIWQRLANGSEGEQFRNAVTEVTQVEWTEERDGVFETPRALAGDEAIQRRLFHAIAGTWMGSDRRRGDSYTWLPKHLSDANGQASPRSFIVALRSGVDETLNRYQDHPFALHVAAIRRGVQAASENRRREVAEEVRWIDTAMEPLVGMSVPCTTFAVEQRWREQEVLDRLRELQGDGPQRIDEGLPGLREELQALGLFESMSDERVNVPDIFRVAFRLKRKGGVKPVRTAT